MKISQKEGENALLQLPIYLNFQLVSKKNDSKAKKKLQNCPSSNARWGGGPQASWSMPITKTFQKGGFIKIRSFSRVGLKCLLQKYRIPTTHKFCVLGIIIQCLSFQRDCLRNISMRLRCLVSSGEDVWYDF